jgi:hypothetical protein
MAGDEVGLSFIKEKGFLGVALLFRVRASGLKETSLL